MPSWRATPLNSPAAAAQAYQYRHWLEATGHYRASTINAALHAVNGFYAGRAVASLGREPDDPAPTAAYEALSDALTRRFLEAVREEPSTRNKLIALLPLYAGLRLPEVVALRPRSVSLTAGRAELHVWTRGPHRASLRIVPSTPPCAGLWRPGSPSVQVGRGPRRARP
ncbi:MAG: hypothetical protein ACRDJU_06625 [Actinomycetota bacterium]